MLPFEFIDELPDEVPEFIELPDEVDDEPLPIVLPELVLDEGLVVLDDDDDGVAVVSVVVVVVVVLPDVPLVPIVPVLLEGVVVLLLEGVVVLLLEGVVVLLLEGVVVVLLPDGVVVVEPLDDCAIAAPPPISNDAAAMAVVLFKNEPMMMTPDVVETKAHRTAMSDASAGQQRMCPGGLPRRFVGHQLFRMARHVDCPENALQRTARGTPMVTSSSFPSSPSTSSTSATDYTRSSSDDALGTSGTSTEASTSSTSPLSMPSSATGAKPDLMDRVVRGAHETVDKLADKAKPQLQRLQEGAGSASESLTARVDQAREMGDEWAESLRHTVRENPLAAVGTALALGLIIARLSR